MKEENSGRKNPVSYFSASKNYTRVSVCIVLLSAGYALGFFSASTINRAGESPATVEKLSDAAPANTEHFPDLLRFRSRCGEPVPSKLVRRTILDRVFNGTSPYENFPPAHAAPLLRRKRIKGWGSTGAVFETLMRRVRPRTIIEVGTFLGASAIHMASLARSLGLRGTQILCVDDFRGWPGFRDKFRDIKMVNGDVVLLHQFIQNAAAMNATEAVLPVPFASSAALGKLCEWGIYGDLIEVDAGHDFHSAWSDINMAYAILRPGGVIFGHDYFTAADDRGVRRAVNLFARVKGLRVQLDGQHWVIDSP
ncbi:hypothetical protein H6P81_016522 [Aristolochia fimbriata]|uniref:Uncharacterized protein n=1 Tax=Aristolochia fimbriata TaxID=158543 RepID=A0AAV7ECC8_ARIFI|nr:hypothetical protein H6P81_016522 [Aristolochia fimbriata]